MEWRITRGSAGGAAKSGHEVRSRSQVTTVRVVFRFTWRRAHGPCPLCLQDVVQSLTRARYVAQDGDGLARLERKAWPARAGSRIVVARRARTSLCRRYQCPSCDTTCGAARLAHDQASRQELTDWCGFTRGCT